MKFFKKTRKQVVVFEPFSTGMDLDFYIFLATVKCKIYILDEAVDSQAERKPDRQKNRYLSEPSHYMQDQ